MSIKNPLFKKLLNKILNNSVEAISVHEAFQNKEDYTFLDARDEEEFKVSHIKNALYVGYKDFDVRSVESIDKADPIIVYCSVGYRSDKITEQLTKQGFKSVKNLYGGIFEWSNNNFELVNKEGITSEIHPYNAVWKVWLDRDKDS